MDYYAKRNPEIALFMGWEQKGKPGDIWYSGFPGHGACSARELRYHSDWDWIMEVLTRIKRLVVLEQDSEELQVKLETEIVRWWEHLCYQLCTLNLDQLWVSVTGFVDWFNAASASGTKIQPL